MKRIVTLLAATIATTSLGGCGSNPADTDEAAGSTESAPAASRPSTAEQVAILEQFRDADPSHCRFYKETSGTPDGDFAGAKGVTCSGSLSPTEQFGMMLLTTDGTKLPAGTFSMGIRANTAPGAYSGLYDLMFREAGIASEAEKAQFRSEMSRWLFAAPNTYSIEFKPFMTTASGMRIEAASNLEGSGMLSVRAVPTN